MNRRGVAAGPPGAPGSTGLLVPSLVVVSVIAAYVAHVVAQHTIEVVAARRLLPRWDLATHVGPGSRDYHLLVTGRIRSFVSGQFPPVPSGSGARGATASRRRE